MNKITILLSYRRKIVIWMIAGCLIFAASYYGIDKKLIVFTAFIIGVFTEIFAGIGILVAAIPVVGPMIIKIISIPIFWILNALGTLVSGIAIKNNVGFASKKHCGTSVRDSQRKISCKAVICLLVKAFPRSTTFK